MINDVKASVSVLNIFKRYLLQLADVIYCMHGCIQPLNLSPEVIKPTTTYVAVLVCFFIKPKTLLSVM